MENQARITAGVRSEVWLPWLWLGGASFLAVIIFLAASRLTYASGFPLDDAWIHQTYARSLGDNGEWAYIPGQPSAGSTSPFWTVLLAAGYFLHIPYLGWTYLLGALALMLAAWLGDRLMRPFLHGYTSHLPWAGLFLIGEWHLAWASVSGMETILYAALVLLVFLLASQARGRGWIWAGIFIGLGVWIRPDSLTLLGPALVMLFIVEKSWKARLAALAWLTGGVWVLFLPYLLFNWQVQGSIWPNTFYAKQAEYAEVRQLPLLVRFWNQIRLPLIGSGIFLLPGFVFLLAKAWKNRTWIVLCAAAWFFGFAFLYALRLPVTYQYGRYLMPAMPVYFIAGLAGTVLLARQARSNRVGWLLARVGIISGGIIWLAFFGIGAKRYAQDVAIIQTEMVETALWIAENTPPESLIAAHDIGAAGYFANRPLVDLAGLISPEVIPFMTDEEQLARYLDERGVDYLETLEGWYRTLPEGKTVVYQSTAPYAPAAGGTNMVVYSWK
jgi:hypothetical protein